MEAWTLLLQLSTALHSFEMQNEDSCVLAAKSLTLNITPRALCINTFDGRTLYFQYGRQVERF